ncbi:MAG: MFS transporter [Candidatus Eisenbacteria bacterium]
MSGGSDPVVAATPAPPAGMRTFFTLWASQSASLIGTMVTLFAINIWQTVVLFPRLDQKPQLAASLTLTTLAFAIPTIFGAPLAGAYADRHDRRRVMMLANVVSGVLSAILIALLATGRVGVPGAAVLLAAYALAGSFHSAAFDASYVMLVPSEQLPRANAMMMTSQALSGLVAPGLAAALVTLPRLLVTHGSGAIARLAARMPSGVPLAILFDMLTFFAAALVLTTLHVPSPPRVAGTRHSLARDLATGWDFLSRQQALLWLLAMFALANLAAAFLAILTPLMVRFTFMAHGTALGLPFETAFALLATVGSLGGVAGGVVMAAWGGLRTRRVLGVLVSMMLLAAFLIGYGLAPTLLVACVFNALFQGVIPALNAHSATLWQTRTPRELQGRVFSTRRMVAQGSFPLGTALAGFLATRLDPGLMLPVLGGVLAVFTATLFANRSLRTIETTPPPL